MRIIYPKPIPKAKQYRVIEYKGMLQPVLWLLGGSIGFALLMQSLPFLINLAEKIWGWL